jgi:hypothetical protein
MLKGNLTGYAKRLIGLLAVVSLMKDRFRVRFGLARRAGGATLASPRNMNRLLVVLALSAALFFAGCAISKTAENAPPSRAQSAALATLSTAELEAKRAALNTEIAAIERDVEMKAGLHMGVSIGDERGRLGGLYREAQLIDRELLRRSAYSKL